MYLKLIQHMGLVKAEILKVSLLLLLRRKFIVFFQVHEEKYLT